MNCCCQKRASDSLPPSSAKPSSWLRRSMTHVQWMVPLVTLALIPKCPACVAAYVFLFTGIGLSFQVASAMRWALIALSVVPLTYLVLGIAWRFISRRLI